MPAPLSIRRMRLSDLDRIVKIEGASFGVDAYDRKLFAEYRHICGELFLVAIRGKRLCGYMLTCIGGSAVGKAAELVSIAVDPALRGKGIATALMDSTIRRLRRREVARFHLMVKVSNDPAIAFYQKYGFRKERLVRRYYEDGADGRRMAKYWN